MGVYADHAATSWPKPPEVGQALADYYRDIGVAASRGTTDRSERAGRIVATCRKAVSDLFDAGGSDRVVFTAGGTDALNLVIRGLVGKGDRIVCSQIDHNAVLRAAHATTDRVAIVPAGPDTVIDFAAWDRAMATKPALACINHASNVTGVVQDVARLADSAAGHNVPVLLDACQTAGHAAIDWSEICVDYLATSVHKGLLGPLGLGVLIVRSDVHPKPLRFGGTGTASERLMQPAELPSGYEAGSLNVAAIAALLAALTTSVSTKLNLSPLDAVLDREPYRPYGLAGGRRLWTRAFTHESLSPQEFAAVLESTFGIECRAGLHCAPLAHEAMGTLDTGGTVRVSFGRTSRQSEVDAVAAALAEIAS